MASQPTLETFVTKLKNIVFFRLVVYFLIIAAFTWLILIFKHESTIFAKRLAKAQNALIEVNTKLYYANNFKNEILASYRKYQDIENPLSQLDYTHLTQQVESLISNQSFLEPVNIRISKPSLKKFDEIINNNQIVMKNYNLHLSFATANFNDFLLNLKELYKIMPQNSVILNTEAGQQDAITPEFISRLSANKDPNIVKAKVDIRIRNIGLLTE